MRKKYTQMNYDSITVMQLFSTNFALILENRPIRMLYLVNMTFDWMFLEYEYKTRTQKFV